MDKVVLIDGNSIMNRAFYGIMGNNMLTSPDGTPTNAVYGFLAIMFKILEDINPKYIGVAFDLKAPTKRHEIFKEYKANRKGMPDELAVQMPLIKEILRAMNICIIEKEGYEADDILGTLAKAGENEGAEVTILTGDRDSFQLASDKITIRIPRTKAGKTETEDFDRNKVLETYGVEPNQLIEVKGLMGDPSDNIPGIAGIGEKTALNIIKEYKTIDNLYKNIKEEKCDYKGKLKEKLEGGEEVALLSRTLGEIDVNVDIEKNIGNLEKKEWDKEEIYKIFKQLRFNKYLERFNISNNMDKEEVSINLEQVTEPSILKSIKDELSFTKTAFFNIETITDNNPTLIIKKKIKNISIYIEKYKKVYVINDCELLKDIFENQEILKCGANLKEAYILLKQNNISPENMMFDTEIAAYVLNSTLNKYNLDFLVNFYLETEIPEDNDTQEQMSLFDKEIEPKYNKKGAIGAYYIYKLYSILIKKLEETEQLDLFNKIEMPLVEVLAEMQINGMYVDKEGLIAFGEKLDVEIDKLTTEIYRLAEEEFNINSPKQLGDILFEKLKLPTQKKIKSGYSTDVEVLEKLQDKHDIIKHLLEYRQIVKLKSTYVLGLLPYINEKTGRIHSSFNQTIASTGRISSSEPNLQNIPTRIELGKQLRKVFKAEGENIFIDADYSQIELRVLADIANDASMISAFENEEDIHREVASQVFKVDLSEVTETQRSYAKAVNFGIVYGISDFGLSEQLKISKKEAKDYIESYLTKYSSVKSFMDNIIEFAKENGYVETKFKRRRYIPELNSKSYVIRQFGNRVALNTPIQGTAADIMKIAMINIYKKLKSEHLQSKMVLQVHDEIIIETIQSEKDISVIILKEGMQNACELKVPLKVDVKEGKDWYTAK